MANDFGKQCLQRLHTFYEDLPKTSIKFLFFLASDLSTPRVKDVLREWSIGKKTFYVMQGVQDNSMYIYQESKLKYFVTYQDIYDNAYKVKIVGKGGDVNHGDHVDFSVSRQRIKSNVLIKTHMTTYVDELGDFEFEKSSPQCNTILNEGNMHVLRTITAFQEQNCQEKTNTGIRVCRDTFGTIYDDTCVLPIYILCRIVTGLETSVVHKGGKKRYSTINGRKYLNRYDEHSKFVRTTRQQKKVVLRGGNYNGVTFFSETFIAFLGNYILKPMKEIRGDLETIQIVYDELGLLSEDNAHMLIIYDFSEYRRNVFYIKVQEALVACYAEGLVASGQKSNLTKYEEDVYASFQEMLNMQKRNVRSL